MSTSTDRTQDGRPRLTAKDRLARWGVAVEHALYSATGNWYHRLHRFPAAYVDAHGYVVFETEAAYRSCPGLTFGRDKGGVGVRRGISDLPGYIRVDGPTETPEDVGASPRRATP